MKGGRPTQTGLQVSDAYASDPSTGNFGFDLPVDAVASVEHADSLSAVLRLACGGDSK